MATQPANSSLHLTPPAAASALPPTKVESIELQTQTLLRKLAALADSASDANTFYSALFDIATGQADCLAMWHIRLPCENGDANEKHDAHDNVNGNGSSGAPSIQARAISDDNASLLWEVIQDDVGSVVTAAHQSGDIISRLLPPTHENSIIAAPVHRTRKSVPATDAPAAENSPVTEMILGYYALTDQSILRQQWLTGMLAQTVQLWQQNRLAAHRALETRGLADALKLVEEICDAPSPALSGILMVNRLRKLFEASQVAFAIRGERRSARVLAVSDVEQFNGSTESGKLLTAAINQATHYGGTVVWPEIDPAQPSAHTLPLQQYGQSIGASSVAAIPLVNKNNESAGALLVCRDEKKSHGDLTDGQLTWIQQIATIAFRQFESVAKANRSVATVVRESLTPRKWSTPAKIALLVFSVAMLIPLPYRVKCDCRVQPTARRFVAAPYDGILEKSLVETGQIVNAGQIIARLDGRQLRIELAGLTAEYQGAKRKSDSSRAVGEVAHSQIAKAEMRRLAAQIQLTQNRMKDLEVRSPIAGIIVSGDLEKAQGAPLETGQTLFEVAPLEKMVAEIGVPEAEIQYVNQDDQVTLKLNAFPFQSWAGKVKRIHPGTEVIDDQTVFVTEVELDNARGLLKPGMEGAAKISTHWTPLGWNLFHNVWENARCWTVW